MSVQFDNFQTSSDAESQINIRKYVSDLWGRKWTLLATASIVAAIVAFWTLNQTPLFKATASVLVHNRTPEVLGREVADVMDVTPANYQDAKEYLSTQVAVACGTKVLRTVVDSTNLHLNENFWPPELRKNPRFQPTAIMATKWLREMTTCIPRRSATIIDIAVTHRNAQLAAHLATSVATTYVDQNVEFKQSTSSGAAKWLSEQLDSLKSQVDVAEKTLFEFSKTNDLISVSLTQRQNLTDNQLFQLSQRLNETRTKRLSLAAQLEQAKVSTTMDPLEAVALPIFETAIISKIRANLIEERQKFVELRSQYLAKHPLVMAQKSKVDELTGDLRREFRATIAGIQASYDEAISTERKLTDAIKTAKKEAFDINQKEIEYRRLKRDAQNAEHLYGVVLTRMKESDLSARLTVNNTQVLEAAEVPEGPISPRVKFNILFGILAGLGVGIVFALLLNMLDTTIHAPEDLTTASSDMVVLGSLPKVDISGGLLNGRRASKQLTELFAQCNPRSKAAEACRAVRTSLLFSSPDEPVKTIVVTSPGPGEGKTLTSTNLAITMAQQGSRVLLIDADLRRPRVHKVFDISNDEGLTTALQGEREIESVIQTTATANLCVLPCGPIPPNPAEICHSERLRKLLGQLGEKFDWIILDSPPVMAVTDAVVLGTHADGVVVVARAGHTSKSALRETIQKLESTHAKILGGVVNDLQSEARYYRYRYGWRHGRNEYNQYYGYERDSDGTAPSKIS